MRRRVTRGTHLPLFATLRSKLSLLFVSLFLFGISLSLLSYHWLNRELNDITIQRLNIGLAPHIAERLQPLLDAGASFEELQQIGQEISLTNPDVALHIFDDTGKMLINLSPQTGWGFPAIDLSPVRRFLNSPVDAIPCYVSHDIWSGTRTFSAAKLSLHEKPVYLLAVLNGSALFDRARGVSRENSAVVQGVLLIALSSVSTIFLGIFALRLLSRRLEYLVSVVGRYRDGDLQARVPVETTDEIGQLGSTINQMADSIHLALEKLNQRDLLRRELISNVSHDLRGPATQIKLGLEAIEGGDPSLLPAMKRSQNLLEQLLEELFQLSQLDSIEGSIERGLFPIEELLEDLVLQTEPQWRAKDLQIRSEFPTQGKNVYANQSLLARLLANLLENAIRYTPQGGSIILFAREREEAGVIQIGVSDTGPGISETELPKIFERFYRGELGRQMPEGSTGLGLAIVKRIAELHESSIQVDSELEKGTTFSMILPQTRPTRSAP